MQTLTLIFESMVNERNTVIMLIKSKTESLDYAPYPWSPNELKLNKLKNGPDNFPIYLTKYTVYYLAAEPLYRYLI